MTPDRWAELHPLDSGVLLELDAFLPRDAWFWDDLPAARAAHAARTVKADDIVAVDVAGAITFLLWFTRLVRPPRPRIR